MKRSLKTIALLTLFFLTIVCFYNPLVSTEVFAKEPLVIKTRPFREKNIDVTKEYKYQLLELILNKTEETDGPFIIEVVKKNMVQSRVIKQVNQGNMTLIDTMTSREREQILLPIRIPIYKGLLGYRIFIVNRRDKEKFETIHTSEELKKLKAGQGHDWPDTQILKANGFKVHSGSDYRGLFGMLQRGRFDYFPRGVTEPWIEIEEEKDRDVIVDNHLALHYYAPCYFFVAKDNIPLADRLERGFRQAIQDGSFNQFFYNHRRIKNVFKLAKIKNRLIFRLKNPLLTPETPVDKKEFWYSP